MAEETTEVDQQAEAGGGEIEHGAYEILKARLTEHGKSLKQKTEALNQRRADLFGGQEIAVVGNERIRTENACVPRDIVAVGDLLLFGYNVQLGMKTAGVRDVFNLHRFEGDESGFEFPPLSDDDPRDFLADQGFVTMFNDLVKYYKGVTLRQLRFHESRLVALMQTGEAKTDRKYLEWLLQRDGSFEFLGDKGEINYPPSHSFKWKETTREDHVSGTHPHVNVNNKVFVECVGGDLTVKVEDNTEDGWGVYREAVEHEKQALHDAKIFYYDAEELILMRILPYREQTWRHLVFNTRDKTVHRIDPIGQSCIMLPENHGIVFPGGYYLLEGTLRMFEGDYGALRLEREPMHSPNGEDVLYVFRDPEGGQMVLLAYNLVSREMSNPIRCNGYSLFDNGRMVVFREAPNAEATKVHPMQIWQTPFVSAENYDAVPKSGDYLEKVGNADLVRGISDCLSICRRTAEQEPSTITYTDLINQVNKTIDHYHWLESGEVGDIKSVLSEIRKTGELVLTEFEKVATLKKQATEAVEAAAKDFKDLTRKLRPEDWHHLDEYVEALDSLRTTRGHVITLKEMRYADVPRLEELEKAAIEHFDRVSAATVDYLLTDQAFVPYLKRTDEVTEQIESIEKAAEITPLKEELDGISKGLELLSDVVGSLKVDDATLRTQILENISEVLSQLNRTRALVEARRKKLGESESVAEFGVQFKLFSQNVASALNMADTPEKCDDTLSALMLQLEELEAKFGEYDQFVADLVAKREEVYNSFSSKKQVLVDQRQRRVQQLVTAGERILEGIVRRASTLKDQDKLNTYFASDAMVMKVRDLSDRLRELNDPVKADELISKLKVARQDSARGLRDRQELFEDGANIVKLGRHRFSINTEPMDLTLVPREGEMYLHITGTDFFEKLDDESFNETRPFWELELVSETKRVYRSEYLAYCMLDDAERNVRSDLSLKKLHDTLLASAPESEDKRKQDAHGPLLKLVRQYANDRYDEGYDRGVHDVDATIILENVLRIHQTVGLLRYSPECRSLAVLTWAFGTDEQKAKEWQYQARSLMLLQQIFGPNEATKKLAAEMCQAVTDFCQEHDLPATSEVLRQAGHYLLRELGEDDTRFATSGDAIKVRDGFVRHLETAGKYRAFMDHLEGLEGQLARQLNLVGTWLRAYVAQLDPDKAVQKDRAQHVQEEAAILLLTEGKVDREPTSAVTSTTIRNLLGQHPRIHDRSMELKLDEFLTRLEAFRQEHVPAYRAYQQRRHQTVERHKHRLRLDEFNPKVMSAFVRNKLINEVYLPLVGDNLAKQMGAVGDAKRTDLMGMLLLISPPGYGKTTLMEYVASRLGLIFVKVNGPSLGHSITSLDPAEADNLTAAQEVEKVNFGLEMANNVMLYLDDIQHCDPEFLQKFISLCDGQRRIEGVWNGRTRTYDLKGKRFCIIMAGNPYTESGGRFQIPDMLANRADTYNLGDVLSGKKDIFELSYLENSLTSNPVLAPMASRDPEDLYKLIQNAQGIPIPASELGHSYSAVELDEIDSVLKKLLVIQNVLLKVNQEYIRSASMDDAYRTEPAFKLQGSYRNMNKMAEKVVPVMNDEELERLITDHYVSESQTLTTGAEQNLLKLAELRDNMSERQRERWDEIKRGFARNQLGGGDDDPVKKVTNVLGLLSDKLSDIRETIASASSEERQLKAEIQLPEAPQNDLSPLVEKLSEAIKVVAEKPAQSAAPDLTPVLNKLGQVMEKISAQPAQAAQTPDLTPVLNKLGQVMEKIAKQPTAPPAPAAPPDLTPVLEKLGQVMEKMAQQPAAPATPVPAAAASAPAQVDLSPFMDKLTTAIQTIASRPVAAAPPVAEGAAAAAPSAAAVPAAVDLSPVLERLSAAMQTLASNKSNDAGIDLRPYLKKLDKTIETLANRPVQVTGVAAGAPASEAAPPIPAATASAAPSRVTQKLAPEGGAAVDPGLQIILQEMVPLLRDVAETIRGPKSKTIVMDPRLVKVFDGLRAAQTPDDVMAALDNFQKTPAKKSQ